MTEEVETTEAPNWMKELEAKREQRLKARLGHEAGAGAPCLNCDQKCPGLDLHFWRKICKNCKCSKEDHDVHDDDIYGWAQFQLLGSKPNKIRKRIVLPGKKDEVELEWMPKGQKETVDKYLKTLPPDLLPVKGSQAAQDRKQMLQKQIPIHDIDPSLCHELTESELKQMNEYIAHMKQNSVGVGKVVQIPSLRANIHNISAKDGTLLMERYPKGIPTSELVKLQAQSSVNVLNKKLAGMNVDDKHAESLMKNPEQNYMRNLNIYAENVFPSNVGGVRDINAPIYVESPQGCRLTMPPGNYRGDLYNAGPGIQGSRQEFTADPMNPSSLIDITYPTSGTDPHLHRQPHNRDNVECFGQNKELRQNLPNIGFKPSEMQQKLYNPNVKVYNYPHYEQKPPSDLNLVSGIQNEISGDPVDLAKYPGNHPQYVSHENVINANKLSGINRDESLGKITKDDKSLPHFAPSKLNTHRDTQNPVRIGNLKDFAFSTYDPEKVISNEDLEYLKDSNKNKLNSQLEGLAPNPYYDDQSPMKTILKQKYGDFNQNRIHDNDTTSYNQYGEPLSFDQSSNQITNEGIDKYGKPLPYGQANQMKNQPTGNQAYDKYGRPLPCNESSKLSINDPVSSRYSGAENVNAMSPHSNKTLPHLNPTSLHLTENTQNPSQINIGAINDVVYQMPEIKSAANEENPLHQRYKASEPFITNSGSENLPACHRCKKSFDQNDFAIQIEQSNLLFHPSCLKCAGCNQILADMFYLYDEKSNEVYCLRDYAKIRGIPRCKACDELIFVKEYTLAENNTFHVKHFCCFECDEPLAGKNYIMEESQPLCLPCYEKLKANRCKACANIIKPDEQGANLNGVHFHATDACFACRVCRKPLLGAKLMFKNETLYCSPDCYRSDQ